MKNAAPVPATRESALFRTEALQHHAETVFGSALHAAPASFSVTTASVSLAAAALVSIVVFGSYTQRETVDGYIAATDGDIRVFPQAAGVVTGLRVREGSQVKIGETLFSLVTSRNGGMSTEANIEVRDAIVAEQRSLQKQATEQERYYAAELARLQRNASDVETGIRLLRRQQSLAERKLELVRRDLGRLEKISRDGFLAERDQDALTMVAVDSEFAVASVALRIAEQEAGKRDAQARIAQLEFVRQSRLAEIEVLSGQVEQRLAIIRAGLLQAVSAPVDGRISALHVLSGQSVRPDTLALNIIADGSHVYAELLVPGRSIGALNEGQSVDLRFDAYPYEKFGLHGATIEQVARSLLLPGDVRFPVAIAEPVYRVRARLQRETIDIEGQTRILTPGLTFKADIRHSERTLIEWLLTPVIGAARRI